MEDAQVDCQHGDNEDDEAYPQTRTTDTLQVHDEISVEDARKGSVEDVAERLQQASLAVRTLLGVATTTRGRLTVK
jgi:hypothetical protein